MCWPRGDQLWCILVAWSQLRNSGVQIRAGTGWRQDRHRQQSLQTNCTNMSWLAEKHYIITFRINISWSCVTQRWNHIMPLSDEFAKRWSWTRLHRHIASAKLAHEKEKSCCYAPCPAHGQENIEKNQANTSDWSIAEADASVPQEHDTTLWHPDLDL
jgi:hypothetical protein